MMITLKAWALRHGIDPIYLRHDGGYTYGGITWNSFADEYLDDEEDGEA